MRPILKIILADDSTITRRKLRLLLESVPGVHIVAEAKDGEEALAAVEALRPDLLILDLRMPRVGGLEVLARLQTMPAAPATLVVSNMVGYPMKERALGAGAAGIYDKSTGLSALLTDIGDRVAVYVSAGDASLQLPATQRTLNEA